MATTGEILNIFERLAPPELALEWDNSGLQVGLLTRQASGVVISLDASISLMEKAVASGANIVITHHPLIFNPLRRVDLEYPVSRILEKAIRDGLTIYSAHTSLDRTEGGINDILARKLGIMDIKPLPEFGRVGELGGEFTLSSIAETLKKTFSVSHIPAVGDGGKRIRRVAVCGGSGASLLQAAKQAGADLLITGDVKYHAAMDAQALGIAVLDIGHFASESAALREVAERFSSELKGEGIDIPVHFDPGMDPFVIL